MKRIGIVAHSAEGGALCFITACHEGERELGAHMHPEIVMSAIPMGLSMGSWESGQHDVVAAELKRGVELVAAAGADFFVCPDNTAHIVFDKIIDTLPIPGIHIAEVVANEIRKSGWTKAGLLGTKWTMNGPTYASVLERNELQRMTPSETRKEQINTAIFDELCQGRFTPSTTENFVSAIGELAEDGAECVILGCTEIPLIITPHNSPLPVLDSTRLLARAAVLEAISNRPLLRKGEWLSLS